MLQILASVRNPSSQFMPPRTDDWYRARSYAHFDQRVSKKRACQYVLDPARVAQHGFLPLLKKTIQKVAWTKDGATGRRLREEKTRTILYASHMDCHVFSKYSHDLLDRYTEGVPTSVLDASTAYRRTDPPKSNIDHAIDAFCFLRDHPGYTAIAVDISKFFDNLNHKRLKRAWAKLLDSDGLPDDHYAVFKAATRYSTICRKRLRELLKSDVPRRISPEGSVVCTPEEFRGIVLPEIRKNHSRNMKGIPQGLPISGMLANLYMVQFDQELCTVASSMNGLYRRYSDDILIIVPNEHAASAECAIDGQLREAELVSNPSKTERATYLGNGHLVKAVRGGHGTEAGQRTTLQYLGLEWDGVRVRLRPATMSRFTKRLHVGVRRAANAARKNKATTIRRRQLYARYSHLGRPVRIFGEEASDHHGNFVSYAKRAHRKCDDAGLSSVIDRQWGRQWIRLNEKIIAAEIALQPLTL